jgi:hypothetical protein
MQNKTCLETESNKVSSRRQQYERETSPRFTSNVVQFLEASKLQLTLHDAKIARTNFLALQASSSNSLSLRRMKPPDHTFKDAKHARFVSSGKRSGRLRKYTICVTLTSKETEGQ